ncbi:Serine/threonine-protein kinase TNNI3K [Aphelenchoides fujianensis]|nr:Serine/threonine-protein kinase TNNI3K [Aphelenchoides fujianensis]
MGNYKSRPSLTCADECKKRISAAYSLVRSRLNDDLKPKYDTQTPFYQASVQGTFDEFVATFDQKYLDEKVPPRDLSLLHLLCIGNGEAGDAALAEALLNAGADINAFVERAPPPLHLAVMSGNQEAGADATICDDEGNTPVHFAACSGHSAILIAILEKEGRKEALANKTNIYGDTPLHTACYKGKLEVAKLLLQETNADALQTENVFNETPLQAGVHFGQIAGNDLVSHATAGRQPQLPVEGWAHRSPCTVRVTTDICGSSSIYWRTEPINHLPHVQSRPITANLAVNGRDSGRNSVYSLSDDGIPQHQTPIIWAYEKGHDQIVALLKFYANKRPESDVCSDSGDSSYTPLPSPMGRLRSITKEKAEVLQLRDEMDSGYRLSLMDIELLEAIGSGSFGKVYRGICKGKVVAVKRYRALAFGSKSEVDIFCREASILCKLKHPNVIGFVGACLDDPSQFAIVTEYAASGSLFSLLHVQKRVLDMQLRLCIGMDVARGMKYLHETANHAVIHRDLNSHNILLHHNGRAVVADFGESRFMSEHEEDNMTKQPGNLRWMAPEVFTQCCRYDEKVDVFSYALVIWEIHTAELPFPHLKPAAAAAEMAYKRNRPQLPTAPTAQFPAHIIEIIKTSWDGNPALRPTFSQILAMSEPHTIPDEERNFSLNSQQSHSDESTDEGEFSETDGDEGADMRLEANRTVSRLKTQWERFCVDDRKMRAGNLKMPPSGERATNPNGVIQKLRQRLDTNGYVHVSQAARSVAASKNATSLRDSFVLARSANVSQRQSALFKEANDQTNLGCFSTTPHAAAAAAPAAANPNGALDAPL